MNLDAILTSPALAGMRAERRWVVYQLIPLAGSPGKSTKVPVHWQTLAPTGVNNAESWTDCASAVEAARRYGSMYGVGYCFTADNNRWFVDLDDAALADGTWSPLAQQAFQLFAGCAYEVSVSGRGLHFFGRGTVPPHASKNADHRAELYHTDRFVALSGNHLAGNCDHEAPAQIAWFAETYFPPKVGGAAVEFGTGPRADWRGPESDEDLIRRACQARSAAATFGGGASFFDLWTRNVDVLGRVYPPNKPGEPYDASSTDAALASHLAFWTGADPDRMMALMRRSALAREKYARDDYLPRTVANACGLCERVCQDKPPAPPPGPVVPPPGPAAPPPPVDTPVVPEPIPPGMVVPEMTPVKGSTFLSPADQREFFRGCVYIVDQHRMLVPGGHMLKPEQFNAKYGGRSYVLDAQNSKTTRKAFEAFTESQVMQGPRADGVCFRPDLPYGVIVEDAGRSRANMFWPVQVPRKHGDAAPFLRHLAKLFPVERDRNIILSYMAAVVQFPGVKFQWAPLIQGVEGNGKSLLSRVVQEAIGRRYCHWPKASRIAKQFNGWMLGTIFVAVEDIYTPENVDVIEELKPMITGGDGLEIEKKGVDQISAEVVCNFILNSNHKNALRKTRNDRRFCVLFSAQQTVEDLTRDGMDGSYMQALYDWLKAGGYAIVSEFLHTYAIPDDLNPAKGAQRAPVSSSTEEAILASAGAVEQHVLEAIEQDEVGFKGGWISSHFLGILLGRIGKANAVPLNRRTDMLRDLGYVPHPALDGGRVNNAVLPDGIKSRLYIKRGHVDAALKSAADVRAAYTKAQTSA